MEEIWKPVRGWDGLYEVSNFGRVRSLHGKMSRCRNPNKILVASLVDGYPHVGLCNRTGSKGFFNCFVHVLVAEAFLGARPTRLTVDHKDGNKTNNHIENLEWVTQKEQIRRARLMRGNWSVFGEKHRNAKLTSEQVACIRASDDPQPVLAARFGVLQPTISRIRSGQYRRRG